MLFYSIHLDRVQWLIGIVQVSRLSMDSGTFDKIDFFFTYTYVYFWEVHLPTLLFVAVNKHDISLFNTRAFLNETLANRSMHNNLIPSAIDYS